MKKLVLATAVAALSVTAAQAAPTVYGKAGVQLNYTDNGSASDVSLDSDSTRLGVKGGEALTANTDLIYKLEYGLKIDENESAQFKSRDTYVGLSNKQLGTLTAGRITSIDDEVDYTNPTELGGTLASYDEARWNNTIVYASPSMSGLQFLGQVKVDDGIAEADSYAVAAKYDGAGFGIGASYIDLDENAVENTKRISAAVDATPELTLSGLYQSTEFDKALNSGNDETESTLTLGGAYDIANSPWSLNAQYDMVENYKGVKDAEASRFAGGAEYAFTKATVGKIYGAVTDTGAKDDTLQAGVGILHKF